MCGCSPRWGTLGSQMVHFSAIAMIHRGKVVHFPAIIRGTFALTNCIAGIEVRHFGGEIM